MREEGSKEGFFSLARDSGEIGARRSTNSRGVRGIRRRRQQRFLQAAIDESVLTDGTHTYTARGRNERNVVVVAHAVVFFIFG